MEGRGPEEGTEADPSLAAQTLSDVIKKLRTHLGKRRQLFFIIYFYLMSLRQRTAYSRTYWSG